MKTRTKIALGSTMVTVGAVALVTLSSTTVTPSTATQGSGSQVFVGNHVNVTVHQIGAKADLEITSIPANPPTSYEFFGTKSVSTVLIPSPGQYSIIPIPPQSNGVMSSHEAVYSFKGPVSGAMSEPYDAETFTINKPGDVKVTITWKPVSTAQETSPTEVTLMGIVRS